MLKGGKKPTLVLSRKMIQMLEVVTLYVYTDKYRSIRDLYKCTCGKQFIARRASVKSGHTKSCGCFKNKKSSDRFTTHGRSRTSEYHTWQAMIQRCANIKNKKWEHYGGRGISVCEEWTNDFYSFYKDMGPRPIGMSLDRIDNNKGYYKDNCRWATIEIQNTNKRQRGKKDA